MTSRRNRSTPTAPRARTWRRRLLRALAAAALLLGSAIAGLLLWVLGSLPPLDGEERAPGLGAEVVLERDANRRVTVSAASQTDTAFGIGYAHGQDRFFQMDLLRRIGSGTLAALIGPPGLPTDKGALRHDLPRTAKGAQAHATLGERGLLEAYTKGVNAGLASLRARPWEYILLRQAPEPWRPLDTYHVVLAMFRDLQDETNVRERVLDAASRALVPEVFTLLTLSPGPWEAPVEGEAGRWPQVQIPPTGPGRASRQPEAHAAMDELGPASGHSAVGSNSFAVAGRLTADGKAILANDMHLGLQVPTIWYPLRIIRLGERPLSAVGVSLPGAPALVAGSNGHIAWGLSNSYGDWLDAVVLELDPQNATRYRTPGGWKHLTRRRELIRVAGGEAVPFEVTESIWGPVVGKDLQGRPLALRWVAQEPEALNLRLLELAEQRSVEQALDLAPQIGVPAQNILVAGADGSIGWTLLGRIPHRVGLDGPHPRSWADGDVGWHGWLTPEEVPRIAPGQEARLWTANARVVSLAEQRLLGDGGYALGARAGRIRDLLEARASFDEPALFAIQLDDHATLLSLWHDRLLALIEGAPDLTERDRLLDLLRDWDAEAAVGSVGYRLVHDWRNEVTRTLLTALGAAVPALPKPLDIARLPRTEVAVWAILSARPAWVPAGYPNWPTLERRSLERVLESWGEPAWWASHTWGKRNTTAIRHPLSQVLADWIGARIDMPAREVPGDIFMPRVAEPAFGASERLVVTPGAEERGILHLPGGANAHPFSPARLGSYEAWAAGEAVPLLPGPTRHRRRLVPAGDERRP